MASIQNTPTGEVLGVYTDPSLIPGRSSGASLWDTLLERSAVSLDEWYDNSKHDPYDVSLARVAGEMVAARVSRDSAQQQASPGPNTFGYYLDLSIEEGDFSGSIEAVLQANHDMRLLALRAAKTAFLTVSGVDAPVNRSGNPVTMTHPPFPVNKNQGFTIIDLPSDKDIQSFVESCVQAIDVKSVEPAIDQPDLVTC